MRHVYITALAAMLSWSAVSASSQSDATFKAGRNGADVASVRSLALPQAGSATGFRIPGLKPVHRDVSPFVIKTPVRTNAAKNRNMAPLKGSGSNFSMPAYGVLVYSDAWMEDKVDRSGIYEIPTYGNPSMFHPVVVNPDVVGSAGMVYAGDKFFSAVPDIYLNSIVDMTYYVFNTTTWQLETSIQGDIKFFATDMTYDATSEQVYGVFVNSEEQRYYFGTLDVSNGQIHEIKDWGVDGYTCIAAGIDGSLYAVTPEGELHSISKRTGEPRSIGETGIVTQYLASATIDPKTGKMYYSVAADEGGALYEINVADAKATLVYNYPGHEQFVGLFMPAQNVEGGAPAAAQKIEARFADGSLSGTVNITAPTLNYNNIPGTGTIEYRVLLNGEPAAQGSTSYGSEVSADVTAPAPGSYTIAVVFSNMVGDSPIATIHTYIGPDGPTRVKNVNLTYADGAFKLTWDAPGSVNGGYINPDEVEYTITRYPDGKITEGHRGTTFTDVVAEPESQIKYRYSVAATHGGTTSEAVFSNEYALGSFLPPFMASFSDESELDDFTIIDGNKDGIVWEWVNGEMKITYNDKDPANDYLVLPPMRLEAGKTYSLAFDVKSLYEGYTEKYAVYAGQTPSEAGLSICLLAPTAITKDTYQKREVFFVPETSGSYFLAIKGCSDAAQFYLCVDNIYLSAAMNAEAPGASTEFSVTPAAKGRYSAELSFRTPDKTISGKPLTAIDRLEIYREGEKIHTVDNAAPGTVVTFTDNEPANGVNNYSVAAFNADGKGVEAHASAYVGVYAPIAVETLTAMRDLTNTAQIYLGWDAVANDINGNPLSSSQVKYDIYSRVGSSVRQVGNQVSGTSFVDKITDLGDRQSFAYYSITPVTAGGEGEATLSELVAVGKPYDLPFKESFPNAVMSHIFGVDQGDDLNPGDWNIITDVNQLGVTSRDNDNGMTIFQGSYTGAWSKLYSGMINIGSTPSPELTFYYYDYDCQNTFDVQVNAGQGFKTVRTIEMGKTTGWTKCTVGLSAYMGREIQFAIIGRVVSHQYIFFDDFRVGSRLEHNLSVEAIAASPLRVKAGEPVRVEVKIKNDGANPAESYAVSFYRNGTLVESRSLKNLDADATETVVFSDATNPASPETLNYHAIVDYALDEAAGDNISKDVPVVVLYNNYPAATGLTAASVGNDVSLAWEEPDFNGLIAETVIDGAESYATFSIGLPHSELAGGDNVGDWTMVDGDGLVTYGIGVSGTDDIYHYANAAGKMAFQVFSVKEVGLNSPAWEAYMGDKMFVCFAAEPDGDKGNDDWMISPLLSGDAQKVSFFAKSVNTNYGKEKFEVLYSTAGTDVADFVKIGSTIEVDKTWEEISVDIPAGAKHFAIHCISRDAFALCIDEISYIGAETPDIDFTLMGYNVYRNGVKLNEMPVEEQEFVDVSAPAGHHIYHVTALFTVGESKASNEAVVDHLSGLDLVGMDGVEIRVVNRSIVVSGAAGQHVAVFGVDGRTVFSSEATADVRVDVAPAIYLVKVGGSTSKVVVK